MAHAVLTLAKADWTRTGAYNMAWSGTATVPAALMAGDTAGTVVASPVVSATSRAANINLGLTMSGNSDLTGTMEAMGTVQYVYGDRSFKFLLSPAGTLTTVFGDTSSPYGWTLTSAGEMDVHNQCRWVVEAMETDLAAGALLHDVVITLWDGQGDSPFPDDPVITYEAEQTFNTPGGSQFNVNSARWAIIPDTPRPAFDAAFRPDNDPKYLEQFIMRKDRSGIILFVAGSPTAARTNTPAEPLSQAFLERGEIAITVTGVPTVVLPMGGPDVFDPRNDNNAPDTTEFYRVDYQGLSAIRYDNWRVRVQNVTQPWQGVFRIRSGGAVTPPVSPVHHHGTITFTGAYHGTKPLRIYSGSKLVADYRPA